MKETLRKFVAYFKKHTRITIVLGILVLGVVLVALGYSYALFTTHVERKGAFTLIVPELKYSVSSTTLNEQNQVIVEAGKKKTLEITVTNTDEVESHFKLYYLGSESEDVVVSYQKNEIYKDGLGTLSGKGTTKFIILVENNSSNDVTITLGAQGGLLNKDLTLNQGKELVEYQTEICFASPNSPVLVKGQIPVVYDSTKSSWVKADTTSDWYDYCNQEWANAVTVTETNRETYMNASVGTPISMDDINTMWVWIPRYEYMYTNLGVNYAGETQTEPGEIKINFLEGKTTTPSDSANYKVHPAFTFGSDELEGLWYAKFETGGTLSSACTSQSCNVSNIVIKPGTVSLRGQRVSSFFYAARSMQMNTSSPFGFSTTDSDLHVSKNNEWGAVAYLSQSKYGKYGNLNYKGVEKEVRINNCSNFITGIGANSQNEKASTSTCTENTYETVNGQGASTTGNITGIYDMSGGSYEYVMGVLLDSYGVPRSGDTADWNSGFTGRLNSGVVYSGLAFPNAKYYNTYTTSSSGYEGSLSAIACNGGICFGHALSETGAWYGDRYWHLHTSGPWYIRGDAYSSETAAGIFATSFHSGNVYSDHSVRFTQVSLN